MNQQQLGKFHVELDGQYDTLAAEVPEEARRDVEALRQIRAHQIRRFILPSGFSVDEMRVEAEARTREWPSPRLTGIAETVTPYRGWQRLDKLLEEECDGAGFPDYMFDLERG